MGTQPKTPYNYITALSDKEGRIKGFVKGKMRQAFNKADKLGLQPYGETFLVYKGRKKAE